MGDFLYIQYLIGGPIHKEPIKLLGDDFGYSLFFVYIVIKGKELKSPFPYN